MIQFETVEKPKLPRTGGRTAMDVTQHPYWPAIEQMVSDGKAKQFSETVGGDETFAQAKSRIRHQFNRISDVIDRTVRTLFEYDEDANAVKVTVWLLAHKVKKGRKASDNGDASQTVVEGESQSEVETVEADTTSDTAAVSEADSEVESENRRGRGRKSRLAA